MEKIVTMVLAAMQTLPGYPRTIALIVVFAILMHPESIKSLTILLSFVNNVVRMLLIFVMDVVNMLLTFVADVLHKML
jgi:hypothetical protein